MRQKRSGPGGGDAEAWKIAPDKRSLPMCAMWRWLTDETGYCGLGGEP